MESLSKGQRGREMGGASLDGSFLGGVYGMGRVDGLGVQHLSPTHWIFILGRSLHSSHLTLGLTAWT